jgi:hypothetical protein
MNGKGKRPEALRAFVPDRLDVVITSIGMVGKRMRGR